MPTLIKDIALLPGCIFLIKMLLTMTFLRILLCYPMPMGDHDIIIIIIIRTWGPKY